MLTAHWPTRRCPCSHPSSAQSQHYHRSPLSSRHCCWSPCRHPSTEASRRVILIAGAEVVVPTVVLSCSGVGERSPLPPPPPHCRCHLEGRRGGRCPHFPIVRQGSRNLHLHLHYSMDCGLWWSVSSLVIIWLNLLFVVIIGELCCS
jgi:hypothetical protein